MRVLVCGGRNYGKRIFLEDALNAFHAQYPITCLIEGEAQGADRLARSWAIFTGILYMPFPASWDAHGRAAGAVRNQRMLDEGKPDVVIAFSGGAGTQDMVSRSHRACVPVFHPDHMPELVFDLEPLAS